MCVALLLAALGSASVSGARDLNAGEAGVVSLHLDPRQCHQCETLCEVTPASDGG